MLLLCVVFSEYVQFVVLLLLRFCNIFIVMFVVSDTFGIFLFISDVFLSLCVSRSRISGYCLQM